MGLASAAVGCWVRPWFMVENGFNVRILPSDWGLSTTGETEGHTGIRRVTGGKTQVPSLAGLD